MQNEARLAARDALFSAIKTSAETNMKAALRATEKAEILRALAEAYRLTVGEPPAGGASTNGKPADRTARKATRSSDGASRSSASADDRPRKRKSADEAPRKTTSTSGAPRKRASAR